MTEFGQTSRRTLLRRGGALLGAGLLGTVAGCDSVTSLGSSGGSDGRASSVPEDATSVWYADVAALRADTALRESVNELLADMASESTGMETETVDDAMAAFEAATGLDPETVTELVGFGAADEDYAAAVVWAEWDTDDVVDALDDSDAEYEEDSHEDQPLYESTTSEQALGVLDDGVYAVGQTDAVEDAIDVAVADGNGIDDDLQSMYADTSGVVRFATAVEDDQLPSTPTGGNEGVDIEELDAVEYLGGGLATADDERTLTLSFRADSESATGDVEDTLDEGLSAATDDLDASEPTTERQRRLVDTLSTVLSDAELSSTGPTVTATYTGDPDTVVAAVFLPLTLFVLGFGQTTSETVERESSTQVTNRLQVVNAVGTDITTDEAGREVTTVELTVKKAPSADDVDLSRTTVQWVSADGTFDMVSHAVSTDSSAADARFGVGTFQDDNDSIAADQVVDDPADRAVLTVQTDSVPADARHEDLTTDDLVGATLAEGSTATIKLTTEAGGETTATLVVPESLSGKDAVSL